MICRGWKCQCGGRAWQWPAWRYGELISGAGSRPGVNGVRNARRMARPNVVALCYRGAYFTCSSESADGMAADNCWSVEAADVGISAEANERRECA